MGARAHRRRRLSRWGLPVALVSALLVTACSGGSPGTGGTASSGAGADPAATPGTVGEAIEGGVTDYKAFLGGSSDSVDPTKPTIAIGWVNVESTDGAPEGTVAAQAAVKYLNSVGGVNGHRVELRACKVVTDEDGQRCGQQMLEDQSVVAVGIGDVYIGDQSYNAALQGKKATVVGVATGPSFAVAENTYIVNGDIRHIYPPFGTFARDVLKARTVGLLYTQTNADKIAAAAARKGFVAAGLTVNAVGFEPQATDLLAPATAAGALTADAIMVVTGGNGCVNVAKALQQLKTKATILSVPVCLTPDVRKGLGGDLPQWTFGMAQTLPSDASAPDAKAYLDASASAGLAKEEQGKVWAGIAWSEVMVLGRAMIAAGDDATDPDAVAKQLAAFQGPVVMGAPKVQCGKYPEALAVCNDQARFYDYKGKGKFVAHGGWLRPPVAAA